MVKSLLIALGLVLVLNIANVHAGGYGKNKRPQINLIPELYPDRYPGLKAEPSEVQSLEELPREYNWCANPVGGCIPNWNQHIPKYFPLCYLHATLSMVGDRIRHALHGKGVPDVTLSRQDVLDCAGDAGYGQDVGGGGEGVDVLEYMRQHGVPDETCNIFQGDEKKCNPDARCMNCMMVGDDKNPHCWPVKNYVKYKVKDYGFVRGEAAMMSEILARGPIMCGVGVDDDFCYKYNGGIYRDPNNVTDVDHDVEVVGWTEQLQVDGSVLKAWVIRNSWGSYFGHNGFFLLERGVNAMRIEEKCTFANVDISELETHLQGHNIGSQFGLINPGVKPQLVPDNWSSLPHDFMTAKEKAEGAAEVARDDKWIQKFIPQPPLVLSGSDAKSPARAVDPTLAKASTATAPVEESSGNKWLFLAVIVIAVMASYICLYKKRSQEYESIPQ